MIRNVKAIFNERFEDVMPQGETLPYKYTKHNTTSYMSINHIPTVLYHLSTYIYLFF